MSSLTETQSLILTAGSRRPGNLALPLPGRLAGAAAKMAVGRMIARGWLKEVDADRRRGEPLWRETGDGHGTTLVVTEAGLLAIGIEPVVARAVTEPRKEGAEAAPRSGVEAPKPGRANTKQAQIIALLQRPEGATVAEIATATGWQAHTVRGAISGALKKKLRLAISTAKEDGRGSVYRID